MARQGANTKPENVAAEWVPLSELVPWERNPRKSQGNLRALAASIKRFGFGRPVVARRENRQILAGHRSVAAAKLAGLTHVPVRFLDLDAKEAEKYAVADNEAHEDPSEALVADLLQEWRDEGDDLEGLGIESDRLDRLLGENYESVVYQVDVSEARAAFFLSVHGPLPSQVEVLEALRKHLEGLDVTVVLTTTEL